MAENLPPSLGGDWPESAQDRLILVGTIAGLYGVKGWLRVLSETEPRSNITGYSPWLLQCGKGWRNWTLETGRAHGKAMVVKLAGCDDCDTAAALQGAKIAVRRSQLADDLDPDQYYWADLEGLRVVTLSGVDLGLLDHLIPTGANDVMVVRGDRERLLPYLPEQVVKAVDLGAGVMRVEWDPEF